MEPKWFPTKVDTWLAVVLCIAPVMCVFGLITTLLHGQGIVFGVLPLVVITAVYLGLVWPMSYGVTSDTIIVRHGIMRQRIKIADITEVRPTRNPLSSPALSLDRLHIQFGTGFFKAAMISPADKEGFLAELQRQRPALRREGDRLVATAER